MERIVIARHKLLAGDTFKASVDITTPSTVELSVLIGPHDSIKEGDVIDAWLCQIPFLTLLRRRREAVAMQLKLRKMK